MSDVDEYWENDLATDAFVIVHNHLYLMEQSVLREIERHIKRKRRYEFGPGCVDLSGPGRVDLSLPGRVDLSQPECVDLSEPGRANLSAVLREMDQHVERELGPEPWDATQFIICDYRHQRSILQLVCRRILYYARRAVKTGYMDEVTRTDIAARAVIRLCKNKNHNCWAGKTEDVDGQCPLKIQHRDLIDPTPQTFHELVKGMNAFTLDNLHKHKLDELMVEDPKRKIRVPYRFCSFHLAGFDLDEMSTVSLGPRYQPDPLPPGTYVTKYVSGNVHYDLAAYSTEVISIRVVKVGPGYTYPVEVYGKVIARDEVDYKCVDLFNRERENAQTINSEKDMLALSGPNRALVTLGFMYFEFDLKIKGEGDPDDDVPFSKGVISYYCNPDHKRVKYQLPSFQSTVKLVLQHVDLPVAASLEVSVANQEPSYPLVQFDGKITAGTTRNYRHHAVLYDSSVPSRGLVSESGSLLLNRNLVSVNGYVEDLRLEKDQKLVLYVCFLDASCELKDVDKMDPEEEDEDDDDVYGDDEEMEVEENEEVDPKNVVTLRYPQSEGIWEDGNPKLKVKVDWTAVLDRPKPKDTDFLFRQNCLPDGLLPDYRYGIWIE